MRICGIHLLNPYKTVVSHLKRQLAALIYNFTWKPRINIAYPDPRDKQINSFPLVQILIILLAWWFVELLEFGQKHPCRCSSISFVTICLSLLTPSVRALCLGMLFLIAIVRIHAVTSCAICLLRNTVWERLVEMFLPLWLQLYFFQPTCSHFQLLTISRSLTETYWPVKQNLIYAVYLRIFKENNLVWLFIAFRSPSISVTNIKQIKGCGIWYFLQL